MEHPSILASALVNSNTHLSGEAQAGHKPHNPPAHHLLLRFKGFRIYSVHEVCLRADVVVPLVHHIVYAAVVCGLCNKIPMLQAAALSPGPSMVNETDLNKQPHSQ